MSKTSHYKATTKRGFEAGELAALLARHSPDADYRVVINFRGKVRELIVQEEGDPSPFVLKEVPRGSCETPADPGARSPHFPRDFEDDQRHGGKLKAALHDPRTQNFQPEGQTWPAAPPWPASENLDLGNGRP